VIKATIQLQLTKKLKLPFIALCAARSLCRRLQHDLVNQNCTKFFRYFTITDTWTWNVVY